MTRAIALKNPFRRIPAPGVFLGVAVFALTGLGLVTLFSASSAMYDDPTRLVRKQALWLACALVAGALAYCVNLDSLRRFVPWFGLGAAGLLALVLVPGIGTEVNGARRWLDFGFLRLQVSEVGKLGLLFALAHYLAANRRNLDSFGRGFLAPCGILGAFTVLVLLEPDFGTAFLFGAVGGLLLFLAGVRLRFLIPAGILALAAFGVAVYLDPVRLERVTSFLDVEGNRGAGTYQLWQGILAFGVGGVEGVGVGAGRQQMSFLPEAHTDFIFAIVGEELGLFFTAGTVLCFGAIFFVGLRQLRHAPNPYQYLVVAGALLFITLQALINLGVVTGCLPTKGMSLPFLSYGGSNLVLMFVLMGLVLNGFRNWGSAGLGKRRDL